MVYNYTRHETKTIPQTEQKRSLITHTLLGHPCQRMKTIMASGCEPSHVHQTDPPYHEAQHLVWTPVGSLCCWLSSKEHISIPVQSKWRYMTLKIQSTSNFVIAAYTVYLQEMFILGQMTIFDGGISTYKGNGNKSNSKVSKLWVIQIRASLTWLGSLISLCPGKLLALFRLLEEDRESGGNF